MPVRALIGLAIGPTRQSPTELGAQDRGVAALRGREDSTLHALIAIILVGFVVMIRHGFRPYQRNSDPPKARPVPGGPDRRATIGATSVVTLLAGRTGLEPAASGVTGRRYNQLNYRPK